MVSQNNSSKWFRGLVGYGICLTRRTSPVRSWAKSLFFLRGFCLCLSLLGGACWWRRVARTLPFPNSAIFFGPPLPISESRLKFAQKKHNSRLSQQHSFFKELKIFAGFSSRNCFMNLLYLQLSTSTTHLSRTKL